MSGRGRPLKKSKVDVRRLSNQSSTRAMAPLDQAVHLVIEEGVSIRMAAERCQLGRGQVERAVKARREKRAFGVVGRPPTLSDDELKSFFESARRSFGE